MHAIRLRNCSMNGRWQHLQARAAPWPGHWPQLPRRRSAEREEERVSLVWTGPHVDGPALRRTDQALQEVIGAARQELLLVSFAVYRVPHIAAGAGRCCSPGRQDPHCVGNACRKCRPHRLRHRALAGRRRCAQRGSLCLARKPTWARCPGQSWRPARQVRRCRPGAALHLQCESDWLWSLTINMELGVIVRGGALPGDVATVFTRLIEHGVLQRMTT